MARALTEYDIYLRLAWISNSLNDLATDLIKKNKFGANCEQSERKLKLVAIFSEIISCYEPGSDDNCLTEEQITHIINLVSKLTGLCFPPTGDQRSISTYLPSPLIKTGTHCFIDLEFNKNSILLQNGDNILLELYTCNL